MKPRFAASLITTVALAGAGLAVSGSAFATDPGAPTSEISASSEYDRAVTNYVMKRDGMSEVQAKRYLATKDAQQQKLNRIEDAGVATDGAYFEGTSLKVIVDTDAAASKVRAAGLTPVKQKGQADLDALRDRVLRVGGGQITSVGADLVDGQVDVRVAPGTSRSLVNKLRAIDGVNVSYGQKLETTAEVIPGQIMRLGGGGTCSLGYTGRLSNGNNVLLTAGHCIEGFPRIYDKNGTHIGVSSHTRFRTYYNSVDMGLVDIDSEDVGRAWVDSRGHSGNYAVRGISKNAVGSELCKAGNTTGWTCGKITGYNRTVNYGGTYVSGLAESTVCTMKGDSGGAYIGVGNLAQGMTSGGPNNAYCAFNSGYNNNSYSFYQPVVDAANYYGVTVDTY